MNSSLDEDKPVLAQFCKNFLPILFSLYTSSPEEEEEGKRLYLLDCIKAYISITGVWMYLGTFFFFFFFL